MKIIIDALVGMVIAVLTGVVVGLCFVGIEALTGSPVSGPAAATTVTASFSWVIVMMAKGGDE
ncbi:MAG: hypothetical protein Q4B05_02030 [Candidatus Saccharibacteria bacterium]|nr:hypothetical protein [Candidatus Saccharibacteria bacterium]